MLSKEVTRLRDKDVRQRRKAVRRLFEDGDPSALPHFLPFLNDQDDWFVERAMIAIERWYDGRDEGIVQSLAKSEIPDRRLLAARVANRLGSPKGILGILAQDDDLKVRIAAWKGLMGLDPSESTLALESTDAAVRRIAVNSLFEAGLVDDRGLHAMMSDPASSVRAEVSRNMANKGIDASVKDAYEGYVETHMRVEEASKAIIESPLHALGLDWVQRYMASTSARDITALTKGFRNSSWMEDESVVDLVLELSSDQLLVRILRKGRGKLVEEVCLRAIHDPDRSSSSKSRIILDRIGRDPSPEFAESLSNGDLNLDDEIASSISLLTKEALGSDSGGH
ncbi:MAG: HEAT repeat domain-containing protein [Euryarchaeota archaeon]|jgi:hypothetical protein